jgi:phage gpG-like protein
MNDKAEKLKKKREKNIIARKKLGFNDEGKTEIDDKILEKLETSTSGYKLS